LGLDEVVEAGTRDVRISPFVLGQLAVLYLPVTVRFRIAFIPCWCFGGARGLYCFSA